MRKLQNRKVARGWGRRATFLGDYVRTLRSPCRVLPSRPGFVEHLAGDFLRRRVHKHRLDARVVDDVDLPARQYLFELEPALTVAAAGDSPDDDFGHLVHLLGGVHNHRRSVGHGRVGVGALPTCPMRGHQLSDFAVKPSTSAVTAKRRMPRSTEPTDPATIHGVVGSTPSRKLTARRNPT